MARAEEEVRRALQYGVHQSFTVVRSHYDEVAFDELSQGLIPEYTKADLDAFEKEVAPYAKTLADNLKETFDAARSPE